jgi:hypothetical protein
MNDHVAAFRTMAGRRLTVLEALSTYLGLSPMEADETACDETTYDGSPRARLHDLVLLTAIQVDPAHARFACGLLWRTAPVADAPEEVVDAIRTLCEWRRSVSPDDVARILAAHARYETAFQKVRERTGTVDCPEIETLLETLKREAHGDHAMLRMGEHLVIVEMNATHWVVGIQDGTDLIVIDTVPYARDGGGRDDDGPEEPAPKAPGPRLLQDA